MYRYTVTLLWQVPDVYLGDQRLLNTRQLLETRHLFVHLTKTPGI